MATMHAVQTESEPETAGAALPAELVFAQGLQPFKEARRFELKAFESAPPLLKMACLTQEVGFVLVDPFVVVNGYRPEFTDDDCREINLGPQDTPLVLAIVNLSRGAGQATVNLAGPLLINPATGQARQVVPLNAAQYSCRHRLV